jgi:hypothetical protein
MPYEFFVPRGVETASEDSWKKYLQTNRFPGNPDVAAGFLVQVRQGIDYVREVTRRKGMTLHPVDIGIAIGNDAPPSFVYEYGPDMGVPKYGHVVMVPGDLLTAASRYGRRESTPDATYDITRDAVHDEFWYLDGVEEADHARFRQLLGKPNTKFLGDTNTAAYDAQQHEFEALFARLEAAKERGVPPISIVAIETRIRLATLWRQKYGAV